MSKYFPPFNNSSENIKVELDLSNYATKKDIKDITHIDAIGFALKTNLAALKTEVDKTDADKLKTVPIDLAKLTNVVKNDVVKKTDYNALKSKVDAIDVSKYIGRTKYETDGKAIYDKIDAVEKKIPVLTDFVTTARFNHEKNLLATKTALTTVENKIPDISTLATKTSLNSLLPVSTFNNKVTELEGKVDDKTKKSASDILGFENRLKQKEDTVNENERGISFKKGFYFYTDQSYLVYDCKMGSFQFTNGKRSTWKSTGSFNYLGNSNMNAVGDSGGDLPDIKNDGRLYVYLTGNHLEQNKVIILNNNNVINNCC